MSQFGRPKVKSARGRTKKTRNREDPVKIEELEIVEKIEPGPSKEAREKHHESKEDRK